MIRPYSPRELRGCKRGEKEREPGRRKKKRAVVIKEERESETEEKRRLRHKSSSLAAVNEDRRGENNEVGRQEIQVKEREEG